MMVLVAGALGALGCADDKAGDTADPVDEDIEQGTLDPMGGTWDEDDDAHCWIDSGGFVVLGEDIRDWEVDGLTGSRTPPSHGVRAHRQTGACAPAASSWCDVASGAEPDEDWTTAGTGCSSENSDTGYLNFTDCAGTGASSGQSPCGAGNLSSCDGQYAVEILKGDAHDCMDYNPVRLEIELKGTSRREVSPASSCQAGSGRFLLWPRFLQDRDEDGRYQAVFLPMQVSGTGRMTRAAWVTGITVVNDQGNALRVVRADQDYHFDGHDQLVDAASKAIPLSGTTSFTPGTVAGVPPIVADEIGLEHRWSMMVDMSWTCGSGATTASGLATGYVLSLDDIGCSAVQDLVLRHYDAPKRVEFEPYGDPLDRIVRPTTPVSGGERVVLDWNFLHLDGVLLSHDASQARIRIDELTWDGQSVCTPGTYTLPVE